jgi:thiamine-monophosphate kinase
VKLYQIGERALIREIIKILSKTSKDVDLSDDCAKIPINSKYLLVSTDFVSEKTHLPKAMTPWQIGWFVVAINLSDIAAKGGKPIGILLAMGLPKNLEKTVFNQIIEGANSCVQKYSTKILGGDTKENKNMTITGTALGIVSKENYMPRMGIMPGDIIAVTGTLGKAALGYYILKNSIKDMNTFIKPLLEPEPRIREGIALAKSKAVRASMDISDGLSASLHQLSEINNVGFEVHTEKLPIDSGVYKLKEKISGLDVISLATDFGGEYELLLAIKPNKLEVAKKAIKKVGGKLTAIGKAIDDRNIYIISKGTRRKLENKGYEHFRTRLKRI